MARLAGARDRSLARARFYNMRTRPYMVRKVVVEVRVVAVSCDRRRSVHSSGTTDTANLCAHVCVQSCVEKNNSLINPNTRFARSSERARAFCARFGTRPFGWFNLLCERVFHVRAYLMCVCARSRAPIAQKGQREQYVCVCSCPITIVPVFRAGRARLQSRDV